MLQIVIYLQKTNSEKVQQTTFTLEETFHRFQVIRLWEQPTEIFLQTPGLLPLAVLSNTSNPANTLQQVATAINAIADKRMQSNLASSTFILAGLVLKKEVVQRLLRRDIMRESVTYQLLVEEVREEFQEELEQKVRNRLIPEIREEIREQVQEEIREQVQEQVRLVAIGMLKEGLSVEIIAKVTGLTLEQVQQLQITVTEDQGNNQV
jgi:predicted transposase/invertase (TIGR01784 family)